MVRILCIGQMSTIPIQTNAQVVVRFLLGNSPVSEFSMPTFQNTLFHLLPAYEDGTECSETSAYKMWAPGNYPEETVRYSEHGESLKSGEMHKIFYTLFLPLLQDGGYLQCTFYGHRPLKHGTLRKQVLQFKHLFL
jgi:hypothetical protein